jgi:hypothetical protein
MAALMQTATVTGEALGTPKRANAQEPDRRPAKLFEPWLALQDDQAPAQ